jgi:hypothetical protein
MYTLFTCLNKFKAEVEPLLHPVPFYFSFPQPSIDWAAFFCVLPDTRGAA